MADNSKKFARVDAAADDAAAEAAVAKLAERLPTQQVRPAAEPAPRRPAEVARRAPVADNPMVQISFSARFATRKQMFQVARDMDVTLKTFILGALREKYPQLDISDADLADLRVKRR